MLRKPILLSPLTISQVIYSINALPKLVNMLNFTELKCSSVHFPRCNINLLETLYERWKRWLLLTARVSIFMSPAPALAMVTLHYPPIAATRFQIFRFAPVSSNSKTNTSHCRTYQEITKCARRHHDIWLHGTLVRENSFP